MDELGLSLRAVIHQQEKPVNGFCLGGQIPVCVITLQTRAMVQRFLQTYKNQIFLLLLNNECDWYRFHTLTADLEQAVISRGTLGDSIACIIASELFMKMMLVTITSGLGAFFLRQLAY